MPVARTSGTPLFTGSFVLDEHTTHESVNVDHGAVHIDADDPEHVIRIKHNANNGVAVLAAIAYHQPITRDGLKDIFGKEISRGLLRRLNAQELIATGPRSPRRGAPYTFVTTEKFLVTFGFETLRDLPDKE